jgi:tRNA-dihydrouridine synthase B
MAPALFCAPLAEVTHSAFRRLVSDFGGYGALFTEMLSGRHLLHEDLRASPYLKRRPAEGRVFYQLMVRPADPVEQIIERVARVGPDGLDLNLACYAPVIRKLDAGSRLFENLPALRDVLARVRAAWTGPLTVKIRLGSATVGAEDRFVERLRAIEDAGIDAITLHVRFFEDKFKRRARHELFRWATSLTALPIIANGDITSDALVRENRELFAPVAGLMIGRMAIARPWIFASWRQPVAVDHGEVWGRLHRYVQEDFPPETALRRVRLFSRYFARNFLFGHHFAVAIDNAPTMEEAWTRAQAFFATRPDLLPEPSLQGL